MLPPYELQNNKFSKALKGYSTSEVDEHLAFVIAKYTELYNAYNELEQRQKKTEAELSICRKNEDAAAHALVNAKAQAQKTLEDAERRADEILASAKDETDKILIEFKKKIKSEKDALRILHARVADFRDTIYSQYHQHIELLESISPELEPEDDWSLDDNEYVTMAVHQIQLDVAKAESEYDATVSGEKKGDTGDSISDEMLEKLVNERDNFSGLGNAALGYEVDSDALINTGRRKNQK